MNVPRQYNVKNKDLFAKVLSSGFERGERRLELISHAWEDLEKLGKSHRLLSIRIGILDYMSAAYAYQEKKVFSEACRTFLKFSIARSLSYSLTNAQLEDDLSIAISLGLLEDARIIAKKALNTPSNEAFPQDFSTLILASLFDLNYTFAMELSEKLMAACEGKEFSKLDCSRYFIWGQAAEALARRGKPDFISYLENIEQNHYRYISKELKKLDTDRPSDLMPLDFWDRETTALISLASDFGVIDTSDSIASSPLFDSGWTREAVHG